MAKTGTLLQLTASLSKAEKRYFRLYTALQQGNKDYIYLFELLEGGAYEDMTSLKQAFRAGRATASFEMAGKHLYKVLMDCLLHLKASQDPGALLLNNLLKADILFEKSLYSEGFRLLQKVQEAAEEQEQYMLLWQAMRQELHYLRHLNFHTLSEAELIQKQMRMAEILKYARNLQQHTSLYELLRHRLLYKGHVRTARQKAELNDLVISELNLVSNPLADTVESQQLHLLFQAHYFLSLGDHRSALKTFYELHALLEEDRHSRAYRPLDHLGTVEGILDSLRTLRRYRDMHYFLEKIQELEHPSAYFRVMIQRLLFIYGLAEHLHQGAFKKALALKQAFEETLFRKLQLLDLDKQAEIYLYTALIYFGNNDLNNAHHYLSQVLAESKRYYTLPVYRTFRLIRLLVHYELGDHTFIRYETRSIKRTLATDTSRSYLLEKIMLKFVHTYPLPGSAAQRAALWEKMRPVFEQISTDKYELQLLNIFDFATWTAAKLSRRSGQTA